MSVVDVEAPADGGGDTASEGVTPPEGGSPKSDAGRKPSFAVADSHLGALAAAAGGPAEDEGPTGGAAAAAARAGGGDAFLKRLVTAAGEPIVASTLAFVDTFEPAAAAAGEQAAVDASVHPDALAARAFFARLEAEALAAWGVSEPDEVAALREGLERYVMGLRELLLLAFTPRNSIHTPRNSPIHRYVMGLLYPKVFGGGVDAVEDKVLQVTTGRHCHHHRLLLHCHHRPLHRHLLHHPYPAGAAGDAQLRQRRARRPRRLVRRGRALGGGAARAAAHGRLPRPRRQD